jgi:hypothetical protein
MFRVLLLVWMLLPIVVLIWHIGPGQDHLSSDRAGRHIRRADMAVTVGDWSAAAEAYVAAQAELPESATTQRCRLALSEATARIEAGQMTTGRELLEQLLKDMERDPAADENLMTSVRHELATAAYYEAWLARLQNASEEQWRPEIQLAQQQLRLLAQQAMRRAASEDNLRNADAHRRARIFQRNLEAAVKLEQMDLVDLQNRPLPEDWPGYRDAEPTEPAAPEEANPETAGKDDVPKSSDVRRRDDY